jgi:RNA methyltransferase, TrmH family
MQVVLHPDAGKSDGIAEVIKKCEELKIPYIVNLSAIEKIAYKENTYCIGIFQKYESALSIDKPHILLEQPRNMGNLGTIIRTMVGFGVKDLAIVKPAADIFDPKVVRSAMGALFSLNFMYFDTIEEYVAAFPRSSDREYYPFMLDGAKPIKEITFVKNPTLVLGNEAAGLPRSYKNIGQSVFIPHSNEIDSLNLSIATAIALYEIYGK